MSTPAPTTITPAKTPTQPYISPIRYEPPNAYWTNTKLVLAQFQNGTRGAHGGPGAAQTTYGYVYHDRTCSCIDFKSRGDCIHIQDWSNPPAPLQPDEPNEYETYFAEPRGGNP